MNLFGLLFGFWMRLQFTHFRLIVSLSMPKHSKHRIQHLCSVKMNCFWRVALFLTVLGLLWTLKHEFNLISADQADKVLVKPKSWTESLLAESETIWKAAQSKRLKALRAYGESFKANAWGVAGYTVFWDYFTPSFHCPRPVERLGRLGDGGKWVCAFSHIAASKPRCVVYSFGVSNEVSFETEILARSTCTVHMYDYTINVTVGAAAELVRAHPARARLYGLGLGGADSAVLRTLRSEMDRHGHAFVDILKVDIEGGEFAALAAILADYPGGLPFGQLQVEVHADLMTTTAKGDGDVLGEFASWVKELEEAGLRIFFTEPNLIPSFLSKTSPVKFYELALLNLKVGPDYYL